MVPLVKSTRDFEIFGAQPWHDSTDFGELDSTELAEVSRVELGSKAKCKGAMRIVAFIQDEYAIRDLMKSQGIPDFRPPPKIPKYIDTSGTLDDVVEYDLIDSGI